MAWVLIIFGILAISGGVAGLLFWQENTGSDPRLGIKKVKAKKSELQAQHESSRPINASDFGTAKTSASKVEKDPLNLFGGKE